MKAGLRFLALLTTLAVLPAVASAQVSLDFERDRMKIILNNISKEIEKNFYDPAMRGLDWKALTTETRQKIEQAGSPGAMITAIFSLVEKLQDSHTVFLPPSRVAKLKFGFEAKAYGDEIRISEVTKKGAAEKAGLQAGDRLLTIEGFNTERGSIDLMLLYFRILRPRPALNLTYVRGNEPPRNLRLEAEVEQGQFVEDWTRLDSLYKLIREAENQREPYHYNLLDGDIGYVQLPEFPPDDAFLDGLMGKIKKAKAMIVDLRGNPGGAIDGLARMVGYFEQQETVIVDLIRRNKTEPLKTKPKKPNFSGPIFILVDSQSASASEMFARHFQRTGRAKVIGDQTSGRVTAARFYSLHVGVDTIVPYGVQVAIARVVFPGGEELEKRGVTPDERCIPTPGQLHAGFDVCYGRAIVMARKALGLPELPATTEIKKKDE